MGVLSRFEPLPRWKQVHRLLHRRPEPEPGAWPAEQRHKAAEPAGGAGTWRVPGRWSNIPDGDIGGGRGEAAVRVHGGERGGGGERAADVRGRGAAGPSVAGVQAGLRVQGVAGHR